MATLILGYGAHAGDIWDSWGRPLPAPFFDQRVDEINQYATYTIGINDPRERARIAQELGWDDEPWVHPNAFIGEWCTWGKGTHINYGASMVRTNIGHHTTISPGVTICGTVEIGNRVLIGAGATICDRVAIGNDVTVGAGAVVLPETIIPDGETWIGVPARVRGPKGIFEI